MMAADRILGRDNPWRELFDAGRTKIKGGAWDYVRENKDYPYYLVRDRFAGAAGDNRCARSNAARARFSSAKARRPPRFGTTMAR